jgi:tripartite-type tricarboxylate transporter receptor subunit TctC
MKLNCREHWHLWYSLSRATLGLACALTAASALAQSWPAKPIKLLVPLAAGSTADIVSRVVGTELAKRLGQPVVVENKPGAGGTIAMAEVARSAPDGYTIAFASQGTLVFNQALYSTPGYDSLKDFAALAFVGGVSNVMIVPPSSSATLPRDIVAAAKAKPGELTFSSGGSGTSHHLSGVLVKENLAAQGFELAPPTTPAAFMKVIQDDMAKWIPIVKASGATVN